MANPFAGILDWVAKHFRKDASRMLIWTGVAGWSLSSLAQIGALITNPNLSKEQKSYLIPQEIADAVVNIGTFLVITQSVKKLVAKLFSTGKFAPTTVRNFLNQKKDLYGSKVGNLSFDIDNVFKNNTKFPFSEYYACKNFYTTAATVGAGILSSNIITPIIRNNMASSMQKNYLNNKNQDCKVKKIETVNPTFKSIGLRI